MNVSVVLCTRDRCLSLAKALESVAASQLPGSFEWEVLVVDNGSSDATRVVVEQFCARHPGRFRYFFEPHPGKAYAMNMGLQHASGQVLAFMDDDVAVDPTWLQNLTAALHDGEWAGAGGRTLPLQNRPLPRWLALDGPYSMGGVVAALIDLGDKPILLDRAPYGTNMAFRKGMFEKYGIFRTDLGPSPDQDVPRPNEDTEFGRRLMAAGERLRYEPSAVVRHPVLESRINKEYILNWWFDFGRASVREMRRRPPIWGIPRRYLTIPKIIIDMLVPRALRWILTLNPLRRFYFKCWVQVTAGQILEIHRQWRGVSFQEDDATKKAEADCHIRN
jgi:glycosyltransferase involved in cell wall biosynthesis